MITDKTKAILKFILNFILIIITVIIGLNITISIFFLPLYYINQFTLACIAGICAGIIYLIIVITHILTEVF